MSREPVRPSVASRIPDVVSMDEDRLVQAMRRVGFQTDAILRGPQSEDFMREVVGRVSNVAYMANAIDEADGVPRENRAPASNGGHRQFKHLIEGDAGVHPIGLAYVALRRAQRRGDDDMFRAGLLMMVVADRGLAAHSAVNAALLDDGVPADRRVDASREASTVRIGGTGAKGPAPSEGVGPTLVVSALSVEGR